MRWLWCVLSISCFLITDVLGTCDSNQCSYKNDPTSITVFAKTSTNNFTKLTDVSFVHAQLIKELLVSIDYDESRAKREFVNFYKEQIEASDSNDIIASVKFDREYNKHSAIWWYTYPSFIHDVLNDALRTQNVLDLLRMGFFLQRLQRQIDHISKNADEVTSGFTVYRGQGLSYDDYDKLKKDTNELLAFNTFLLAHTDREAAFSAARRAVRDGSETAVLFSIDIEPSIGTSAPFVCLDDLSYFENSENEYLFSPKTIFRIAKVEKLAGGGGILLVTLRPTHINDKQVRQIMQTTRKELQGSTSMYQLAKLLIRMKEYSVAETIYSRLLNETAVSDFQNIEFIHHQLGIIQEKMENFSAALASFEHSIQAATKHRQANDSELGVLLSRIGDILKSQNKFDAALDKYQEGLRLVSQNSVVNYHRQALVLNDIGLLLYEQEKYGESLQYLEQSLAIYLEHSPHDHLNIGTCYSNIALAYKAMKDYVMALSYYEKSLAHRQQTRPLDLEDVVWAHFHISKMLAELDQKDNAIQHAKEAATITSKNYPESHVFRRLMGDHLEELMNGVE